MAGELVEAKMGVPETACGTLGMPSLIARAGGNAESASWSSSNNSSQARMALT